MLPVKPPRPRNGHRVEQSRPLRLTEIPRRHCCLTFIEAAFSRSYFSFYHDPNLAVLSGDLAWAKKGWLKHYTAYLTAFQPGLKASKGAHYPYENEVHLSYTPTLSWPGLFFLAGNNQDAMAVLVLSSTTFLATVRYMIPAWRSRNFLRNRYLAWTGPSRTAIENTRRVFCGTAEDWRNLGLQYSSSPQDRVPVSSDGYGWHLWVVKGIKFDSTDILRSMNHMTIDKEVQSCDFVFDDGNLDTNSVPVNLLKSQPLTMDGFSGEGLCLAMGILGRNTGMNPFKLVFELSPNLLSAMEANSTWYPRPSKTLRSHYMKVMNDIYGNLGPQYVGSAVELALVLMDAAPDAIKTWLTERAEQQIFRVNKELVEAGANQAELQAHYESSYVSMFISLNNMADRQTGRRGITSKPMRPDIICLGLLLRAHGQPKPAWWELQKVAAMREVEKKALAFRWEDIAARLLGLGSFPVRAESCDEFDYWAIDHVTSEGEMTVPTPHANRSSGSGSTEINS